MQKSQYMQKSITLNGSTIKLFMPKSVTLYFCLSGYALHVELRQHKTLCPAM